MGKYLAFQCKRCRFDPWVKKTSRRRKWQTTPVFLPGKFCEQRSLVGCNPWGHIESNTTELLSTILCYKAGNKVHWYPQNSAPTPDFFICQGLSDVLMGFKYKITDIYNMKTLYNSVELSHELVLGRVISMSSGLLDKLLWTELYPTLNSYVDILTSK